MPQSVSLDKQIVEKLDSMADRGGLSKSQLVESLVTKALGDDTPRPTILTFLNFKGGVAKTTSATSLAISLGQLGKKVLIIDYDAQGNASQVFNKFDETEEKECIFDVLFSSGLGVQKKTIEEVMETTDYENVSIVPSNFRFLEADSYFRNEKTGSDNLLKYAIEDLGTPFDYIIIDCGPRLDMTTTSALAAMEAGNSNSTVVIPAKIDGYTIAGMPRAIRTIQDVARSRRQEPQPWRILITIAESRTVAFEAGLSMLKEKMPDAQFYNTQIPKSTKTNESSLAMMPLAAYEPDSPTSLAYLQLAREIENMNE